MAQCPDRRRRFLRRVDEVFGKGAYDAIAARVDLAEPVAVLARRLDDGAGGGIDGGGDAAGLGVKAFLLAMIRMPV